MDGRAPSRLERRAESYLQGARRHYLRDALDLEYAEDYFPSGYDPYHAVLLEKADRDSKNRYIQTLTPGEELAPGLLLHDEDLFRLSRDPGRTDLHGVGEIPEVLADPPETWRFMDRIRIGKNNAVVLYKISRGTWPKLDNP